MASSQVQRTSVGRAGVADRVASKVKDALRSDKAFEPGSLALSASIAGAAAAAVVDLPIEARRELGSAVVNEYAEVLRKAIRKEVGVKKNDAAIKAVRSQLGGDS